MRKWVGKKSYRFKFMALANPFRLTFLQCLYSSRWGTETATYTPDEMPGLPSKPDISYLLFTLSPVNLFDSLSDFLIQS